MGAPDTEASCTQHWQRSPHGHHCCTLQALQELEAKQTELSSAQSPCMCSEQAQAPAGCLRDFTVWQHECCSTDTCKVLSPRGSQNCSLAPEIAELSSITLTTGLALKYLPQLKIAACYILLVASNSEVSQLKPIFCSFQKTEFINKTEFTKAAISNSNAIDELHYNCIFYLH